MSYLQAKYILKVIYQVIANLVHKFYLQNIYLDMDEPWSGIQAGTTFEVLKTNHTMIQAISVQLVFNVT